MDPRISVHELSKVFPLEGTPGHEMFATAPQRAGAEGKRAVDCVSLTIGRGERVGIVGRNGAGKSTLLHMIAGLSSPTSGSVQIDGKVTSVMTLGVGLRDELSGRENIYVDGAIQGRSRAEIEAVVEEIIAFSELLEFIDYPVRTYSTGMKARLAFSMIAHIDPEILIIDEALSAGDAAFSTKATARIREICARGQIVIVVSHSMPAIRQICNRCLWLEDGRVIMDGHPDQVTAAYIESVRSADEAQLMEKFRRFIGSRSTLAGWEVADVALFNGDCRDRRALLEAGRPTRIDIKAMVPPTDHAVQLQVRVTRLDGLLVFDESFPVEDYRLSDGSVGLAIEMASLVLGAAVYRLDAILESAGTVNAVNSCIFEVYALNPPTGGKPLLLYPVSASVATVE